MAKRVASEGLNYTDDGNTIFSILEALDQEFYRGDDIPQAQPELTAWLHFLDGAYGWDHATQTQQQEKQVLSMFCYIYLVHKRR